MSHNGAKSWRHTLPDVLERAGLPIILVALIIFFSVHSGTGEIFRSSANINYILTNQSVTGIIALAMVIPLSAHYFDLTVPATAAAANVAVASVAGDHGQPLVVALLVALGIGVVIGCVNGFLVAGLRLNGFIVTLGTFTLVGGLVQLYTGGETLSRVPAGFVDWSSQKWLGVPVPLILLLALGIVVWYVLMHTPYGRRLESIGSNEVAARLVGIRVDRTVFMSFIASSLLATVAGALLASRSGVADPSAAPAYLFPALAAVFLGSTTLRPGRYNVWGTLIGVYFVAVSVTGLTLMGAQSWVTPVFNGGALVVAVAVSTLMGRRRDEVATEMSRREAAEPPAGPAVVADGEPDQTAAQEAGRR